MLFISVCFLCFVTVLLRRPLGVPGPAVWGTIRCAKVFQRPGPRQMLPSISPPAPHRAAPHRGCIWIPPRRSVGPRLRGRALAPVSPLGCGGFARRTETCPPHFITLPPVRQTPPPLFFSSFLSPSMAARSGICHQQRNS